MTARLAGHIVSRRRAVAAWLSIAGAAIAGLLLLTGAGGASPASASASGAPVRLDSPAIALAQRHWRPLRSGQFAYIRSAANYPQAGVAGKRPFEVDEAWMAADGTGRLLQRAASGTDVIAFGAPKPGTDKGPWLYGPLGYRQLIRLPTNPRVLTRWIEHTAPGYGQQPVNNEQFTLVGDVLRNAPAPPRLRAAFLLALARLPGVQALGQTRDELGRTGVAFAMREGSSRSDLIFDPRTARLLGERTVALKNNASAHVGDILGWNVIETEAVVRSDRQRPPS